MQEQEVEVLFCDLCGTSVPEGDLESSKALRHEGKTIGACCLTALRAGAAPPAPAKAADGKSTADKPASQSTGADGGRLLTVAIVLLAALAGGVIFLDGRLSRLEDAFTKAQTENAGRQKSDSEMLMGVSLKVDEMPDSADLKALAEAQKGLGEQLTKIKADAGERGDQVRGELDNLRTRIEDTASRIVDYRPLFEDLRQRQQRALEAVEGMLREASARAVEARATPEPAMPQPSRPANDLPEDLAAEVGKLASADPAVRFEAVDILVESKNPKVLPHLLPLAKDPDAFVRRLTVEGLREFRKPEAVDALIAALTDDDENVCDTAWRSLRDLTGQNFAFDAAASKEARGRQAKRWTDWWEKARATFGS